MKKVCHDREGQVVGETETPKGRKRGKVDDDGKHTNHSLAKKAKTSKDAVPKLTANPSTENRTNSDSDAVLVATPKPVIDPSRHANTVFLSNLNFDVSEEDIRTTMSASGTITDIRLVRDYKQRSKGYCYVEFSSQVYQITSYQLRQC